MKVYLDDERQAPPGWVHVKTVKEALSLLRAGGVTPVSLDHDLGDDDGIGTGYDVLLWLEQQVFLEGMTPPEISIHTANISARKKMELAAAKIELKARKE